MIKIIENRGNGKTTDLIYHAKEQNATIVCESPDYVINKAQRLGVTGIKAITYNQYYNTAEKSPLEKYMIDELDGFLKSVASRCNIDYDNLVAYTLTKD